MKDAITIERVNLLHPERKWRFEGFVNEIEDTFSDDIDFLRTDQALRTFAEQHTLWLQGRYTPGPRVTRADSGESWHCYGLAVDVVPFKNGVPLWKYDYSKFHAIAIKWGLTWGQPWKDNDHYEDNCGQGPSGWNWALSKYNAKDFIPGTQYINLPPVPKPVATVVTSAAAWLCNWLKIYSAASLLQNRLLCVVVGAN
jgi:hypothetical protein